MMKPINKLNQITSFLKNVFVGKDEIIDLLAIALVARENAFLLGPPGTAKSAIIKQLSNCIKGGNNFEYLLTRFTEPNEIFGPFDIRKLKEGDLVTNTEGMLPEASLIFLDEIFNANSAILNSLLMALNEKMFRRGKETKQLPALMFVGASNQLPEEESLEALLDRFLIRVRCDYVDTDLLENVLVSGWKIERKVNIEIPNIDVSEIIDLQNEAKQIDLTEIRTKYVSLIRNLRNIGVKVSDRRAVKIQNLIAASALLSERTIANNSDLWVLKYIWDTEEQIEIISGLVENIIESEVYEKPHHRSSSNSLPNAEELMKQLESIKTKWLDDSLQFHEQSELKDKLRFLQSRCKWIANSTHKNLIESEVDELWKRMVQS